MDSKNAILKTVAYSDVFQYALTFNELYHFLLTNKHYSKEAILKELMSLKEIVKKGNYYALTTNKHIIALRKQKEAKNEEKIKKAKEIARKLFLIPTVLFIGISGGVAMKNAAEDDDIDFFVITKKNTVWISRLLLVLFLSFLGVLRKRTTLKIGDTICLNMLLDESALSFPKEKQDIYTAHEIMQLFPLIERKKTYTKFLQANTWVKQIMFNSTQYRKTPERVKTTMVNYLCAWFLTVGIFEHVAKGLQQFYMKSHITKETVSSTVLAFHPIDYREKTLKEYKKRIKKYV